MFMISWRMICTVGIRALVGMMCTTTFLAGCKPSVEAGSEHPASPGTPPSVSRPRPPFVPGEVLVKFKPGTPPDRMAAILREAQTTLLQELPSIQVLQVKIVGRESVENTISQLMAHPEVEYAEPNVIHRAQ
jgi:serine protease